MSITYESSSSASTTGSQSSLTVSFPAGAAAGDLFVLAIGLEGRASGSGPWVDPSGSGPGTGILGPGSGWTLIGYQAPSATGNGLEVWAAVYGTGSNVEIDFTGSYAAVAAISCYRGVLDDTDENRVVRTSAFQQWTGDDPECPAVVAVRREITVACAAHQLTTPGYGNPTPSGWTTRVDAKRGGSYGNVEVCIADKLAVSDGDTGTIPFAATAASGSSTKGATATLAVRPLAEVFAATSPLIAVEFATS